MDIGEFTIYNAYLSSALFGLIAITVVGGMESYPPGFLGLKKDIFFHITYHIKAGPHHALDLGLSPGLLAVLVLQHVLKVLTLCAFSHVTYQC